MSSSRSYRNRFHSLISRRPDLSIERLSLHSCLYHIRPYCSSSTASRINEICLRRLLKSNYSCQFHESKQIHKHQLLPTKSTFILGQYMFILQLNMLRLYVIDKQHLIEIGEDICQMKIVFIGICTYSDFHGRNRSKQDGFILMSSTRHLFLYDFKLQSRLNFQTGINIQCEIPVNFREKSFDYHEQAHMISFHSRYKQHSHVFILLRIWPSWLSYVFLIEPNIFGQDLRQAAITHEFLILQNDKKCCNLYSLQNILDQFTIQSHSVSSNPTEPLPVNVIITTHPPCLLTFNSERPLFDYAFCSTQYFLTYFNDDYFVRKLNHDLTPIINGQLKRSWTDNLSANNLVYFIDTNHHQDYIIDIRESIVHVWQLFPNEVKHLYTIDDGIQMNSQQTQHYCTRYGREITSKQQLDLSSTVVVDHYFDPFNHLLTLLFESESSDLAIIRLIEHPHGICRQTIHFKKLNKQNQLKIMHEHDKLIVQELSHTTILLRIFTLQRCLET